MSIECIFLDNGGVITDNRIRSVQYRKLVAAYFAPRFGGVPEEWEAANSQVFPEVWQRHLARLEGWHAGRDLQAETLLYYADWLRTMFARAGVSAPEDTGECAAIGRTVDYWINPQIAARFPGVDEAIPALAARCRLYAASDGFAGPLADAFGPNTALFQRLYGPELVNVPKSAGEAYYRAIFADAGVDPAVSLVVDDNAANLSAARMIGVRTVRVGSAPPAFEGEMVIPALVALPRLIKSL